MVGRALGKVIDAGESRPWRSIGAAGHRGAAASGRAGFVGDERADAHATIPLGDSGGSRAVTRATADAPQRAVFRFRGPVEQRVPGDG